MSLQETLHSQKKGVAQLIHTLFGSNGSEIAAILEHELGEQIKYDHRERAINELDALWQKLPSIGSLIGQSAASDLDAIKSSSYAFRLMALAQCQEHAREGSSSAFLAIYGIFGISIQEVRSYANDFIKQD